MSLSAAYWRGQTHREHYTISPPPTVEEWAVFKHCEFCHNTGFLRGMRVCHFCKIGHLIFAEEDITLHQCNYKYHTPGVTCYRPRCIYCKGSHHASSHHKGMKYWRGFAQEWTADRARDQALRELKPPPPSTLSPWDMWPEGHVAL